MINTAIEKIITLKRPEIIKVDNKKFRIDGYKPVLDEYPDTLNINNLTGIVDFCELAPEKWGTMFVHVEDFNKVFLYQSLSGDFNQRVPIIKSSSRPCQFKFGSRYDVEQFIISMYGMFIPNADREYLLKFVSGVKIDASANIVDDGTSQTVTAKSGISSLVSKMKVKNPVTLAPFRTFSDIEQPASEFVFRLGKNSDGPVCSLHECDGEAWKQEAILKIKSFFKGRLNIPIIA